LASLAKLYEDLMDFENASRLYARFISDIPDEQQKEILLRWSFLEKRKRNYSQAVELWKWAAQYGDVCAMIELAKFYEHNQKDYEEAIRWVENAMDVTNNYKYQMINQQELKHALAHRYSRLKNKLHKSRSLI
jgi:TPR repeat protein